VVEAGPGLGTLTDALLEAGASVWAVERDPILHGHLAASFRPRFPERLHLMEGDAVEHPLAGLAPQPGEEFKVVANLPYAISTPWMDAILSGPMPCRMVLMLQQEAADRFLGEVGSKQFGAISIFLQAAYDPGPGHRVSAQCFYPRPEVESQLLTLERKAAPVRFPPPARSLIRACFQQRRKQIGALLRGRLPDGGAAWLEQLRQAGLSPQTRPEAIPVGLWSQLQPATPTGA
jgi:16S rRNA (adenine1518-N6/adenine1519-N6)-dimethyltransferase